MKKRLLCLVLALALVLSLAACGSSETAAETTEAVQETAEAPAEEAAEAPAEDAAPASEEAPAEAPAEEAAPAAEETSAEAPAEEAAEALLAPEDREAIVSYPVGDGSTTLTAYFNAPGNTRWYESYNDMPVLAAVNEATGINVEFVEVPETTISEQFNLMIASGDWCDMLPIGTYYSGGTAQAYTDEVILDVAAEAAEFAPDYMYYVNGQSAETLATIYTDDMMLAFCTIDDSAGYNSNVGTITTRGDWLEAMGYDYGEVFTIDEYTDLLYQVYETYAPEYTLYVGQEGSLSDTSWAFDISAPSMYNSTDLSVYVDEDVIKTPYVADQYYDYLVWFKQLFDDQIINNEFYISSMDMGTQLSYQANGNIGFWGASADKFEELYSYTSDPNAYPAALPMPRPTEDATEDPWIESKSLASESFSVAADSEQVEAVCQWMNFFFTKDGMMFANYGEEGDLYTYDENGEPVWTEKVTNPTDVPNAEMAIRLFAFNGLSAYYGKAMKLVTTFSEAAQEAMEIWALPGESQHSYPTGAELNADEQDQIQDRMVDICTVACEELLKFVTGATELTPENWDAYVATLEGMGLADVLAVYQNAYDTYLGK